jgi:hypothetical protein
MTAPSAPGTYNPTFQPFDSGTCATGTGGTTFTLTGGVTVDSSVLFSEYFGSASNPDTPFWNDENQLSASDCEDIGPVNGNWFESLAKGCTISTTNLNSRPINTFGRQNIHVKFAWGKNNLPNGTANDHLDLYRKPSSSSTWSGPVCQPNNHSCSHTVNRGHRSRNSVAEGELRRRYAPRRREQYHRRVKSNSWQGGGLTFNVNGDPTRATFTGKATVQRYVNGVFDATFSSGGYTFTVDDFDGDLMSPRVTDGYAIVVRNSSSQIVKQLGSRSTPLTLGGGNILVQKA